MKRIIGILMVSIWLLSGCGSKNEGLDNQTEQDATQDQPMTTDSSDMPIAGSDTETSAYQEDVLTAQELLEQADSPLSSRVIYFDYDSAKISDDSLALLEAHGNFIAGNGNVYVRLEGHADERGSREYNIGLGDRRAQSVRRMLLFQGSSSDQIDTISYGEEQPAVLGHDESAWTQNRRVELVYTVK